MELAKLITSLFSQRQGAVWTTKHTLRQAQGKRKGAKDAKCFRVFRALSRRSCSKPFWTTLQVQVDELTSCRIPPTSPQLQPFAPLLDVQPPEIQEAFQFLLATAMHEAGKFGPRNTRKAAKGAKCFRDFCSWRWA
jgi:hypothetical protein